MPLNLSTWESVAVGAVLGAATTLIVVKKSRSPHAAVTMKKDARWESVLNYWFYKNTVKQNQHGLWFCPEGSGRQREVDEEIFNGFFEFFEVVVNKQITPDPTNPNELAASIVILDQFSRHIYRYKKLGRPGDDIHDLALKYADTLFALDTSWIVLPPVVLVFSLLPYRHHKSTVEGEKAHHEKALKLLEKIEERYTDDHGVAAKFRTATIRRHQALCDVRCVEDGILEKEEFTPPIDVLNKKPREVLVRTIAKFLINRGEAAMKDGVVCVSLSGGVDSMVICDVFVHLRDHPKPVERARKGQYTSAADRRVRHNVIERKTIGFVKKIIAVHIDYGNRDASGPEADFLQSYCERRGIVFIKKTIEELKRASTSRDEYEELTRTMRYDEYRGVMKGFGVTGICLGHHSGDVVENLLSNANKGCGVLDLSGMREASMMEDVPVWRPLLPHNKIEIFSYAHLYGVPYFKDTTPSWSTRGKLRNNLMPCLEDTYGSGTAGNLHSLALESDAVKEMVYDKLVTPFMEKNIVQRRMGVEVDIGGYEDHGRLFWKELFKSVQHGLFNTAMLSDTALREVAVRLGLTGFEEGDKKYVTGPQEGWVEPKKGMFWFFENGVLYIPHPVVFSKKFTSDAKLVLNEVVHLGSWKITAKMYPLREDELGNPRCTDHRALPTPCRNPPFTWPTFLSGRFEYYIQVEPSTAYLNFQPSGIKTPWAWKQMHHRFHECLPICCTPPVTTDEFEVVCVTCEFTG